MSSHRQPRQLLQDPRIWRAGQVTAGTRATVATGWPDLDRALGGGWPLGQLTELLVEVHGRGELTLLLPALCRLTAQREQCADVPGWAVLVAPPYVPYAPALVRTGLDLSRLLLVQAGTDTDALWAMEQALHSGTCAAVVAWASMVKDTPLRRLQLAAEAGNAWVVLFRPARAQRARSPAPLRIHLAWELAGSRLVLSVLKRRGGMPLTVGVRIDGP